MNEIVVATIDARYRHTAFRPRVKNAFNAFRREEERVDVKAIGKTEYPTRAGCIPRALHRRILRLAARLPSPTRNVADNQ